MNFTDLLSRYRIDHVAFSDGYNGSSTLPAFVEDGTGNLISSRVRGCTQTHMPVIDLDMDVHVAESTTPGHHHLIIDHQMSWRAYKRLLRALYRAGLIERSWYLLAKRRKMTAVRTDQGHIPASVVLVAPTAH